MLISLIRRRIAALVTGVVMMISAAQAVETVTVIEYYNKDLDAYFISGRASEQQALDGVPAFTRTGAAFVANPAAEASSLQVRVCRFYVASVQPFVSSHFFGREGVECAALIASPPQGFSFEGYDFAVAQPDAAGRCAADSRFPVYRIFRTVSTANGVTPNHRYVNSIELYNTMIARGWSGEGVAFCATAVIDVGELQTRAELVRVAAENNPNCTAIAPFYYELGDGSGSLTSGSVGGVYRAATLMPIASSSKWLYGAYVAEMRRGNLSADDVRYLTFKSGYVSFTSCAQSDSVGSCAASGTNGQLSASAVGKFFYSGGHMQVHAAQLMGLAAMENGALASEINRGLSLAASSNDFRYSQPQLAGGIATTPTVYASFLRRLLNKQLVQATQLNAHAVCTNPLTCSAALYTPFPANESPNYAIGHWVEDATISDGAYSSAGLFGFYPWIDATKTLYGIIARVDAGARSGGESVACGRVLRQTWATAKAILASALF